MIVQNIINETEIVFIVEVLALKITKAYTKE